MTTYGGRGIFASKEIKEGDLLIVDKALGSSSNS